MPELSPEMLYLQDALEKFNRDFGGDDAKHTKFKSMRASLIKVKLLPDKALSTLSKNGTLIVALPIITLGSFLSPDIK